MGLELIAAIIAGFALGGIAWILRRWTNYRLPKWIVPLTGGLGLIGFTVWSEYDWFSRVSAELPNGVAVVDAPQVAMPLRPWTYLAPLTTRFTAIDHRVTAAHPDNPNLRVAREIAYTRWGGTAERMLIVDCAGTRQALLAPGITPGANGELTGADWREVGTDDKFQQAACQEG
jgi:hypothetical protein